MANKCCGSNDSSIEVNTETCEEVTACCSQAQLSCDPNCSKQYLNNLKTSIVIINSWNIPACGVSITLTISENTFIPIKSFLWNSNYGYFEIIAYDELLRKITILNSCLTDVNIGTQITSYTSFVLVASPKNLLSSGASFLVSDFIAPAINICIIISVTNTTKLTSGAFIRISSAIYQIQSILSDNLITICNLGEGFTPGTSILAKNSLGELQYPIIIISSALLSNAVLIVIGGGLSAPILSSFSPTLVYSQDLIINNPNQNSILNIMILSFAELNANVSGANAAFCGVGSRVGIIRSDASSNIEIGNGHSKRESKFKLTAGGLFSPEPDAYSLYESAITSIPPLETITITAFVRFDYIGAVGPVYSFRPPDALTFPFANGVGIKLSVSAFGKYFLGN